MVNNVVVFYIDCDIVCSRSAESEVSRAEAREFHTPVGLDGKSGSVRGVSPQSYSALCILAPDLSFEYRTRSLDYRKNRDCFSVYILYHISEPVLHNAVFLLTDNRPFLRCRKPLF